MSHMAIPEYMRIPIHHIPQDIIDLYQLSDKIHKGYVYIKIKRGMYGLKQAAHLAFEQLKEHLAPHGYYPVESNPGLWAHKTRKTRFCLCVDDFGMKYYSKADADHLINILQQHYKVSIDWSGKNYCGLNITWNYDKKYVDISMDNYIPNMLKKFQHPKPKKPCYTPFTYTPPNYGAKIQYTAPTDTSNLLDKKQTKHVQAVIGSLLYYARAVDPTLLVALNELSTEQAKPTKNTLTKLNKLLDYVATYPNAILRFHTSDMVLHVDSDAAYLVLPEARSRIAGHYFLSDHPDKSLTPTPNAPILTECRTLRHVVASAAEAETGGLFHNARTSLPIRQSLEALNHPQPPTPIKTDNSTAKAFVTKKPTSKTIKIMGHALSLAP